MILPQLRLFLPQEFGILGLTAPRRGLGGGAGGDRQGAHDF